MFLMFILVLAFLPCTCSIKATWTPTDVNDGPLPLSTNYRNSLRSMCKKLSKNRLPERMVDKRNMLEKQCTQLARDDALAVPDAPSETNTLSKKIIIAVVVGLSIIFGIQKASEVINRKTFLSIFGYSFYGVCHIAVHFVGMVLTDPSVTNVLLFGVADYVVTIINIAVHIMIHLVTHGLCYFILVSVEKWYPEPIPFVPDRASVREARLKLFEQSGDDVSMMMADMLREEIRKEGSTTDTDAVNPVSEGQDAIYSQAAKYEGVGDNDSPLQSSES